MGGIIVSEILIRETRKTLPKPSADYLTDQNPMHTPGWSAGCMRMGAKSGASWEKERQERIGRQERIERQERQERQERKERQERQERHPTAK